MSDWQEAEIERLADIIYNPEVDGGFSWEQAHKHIRAILKALREPSAGVLEAIWRHDTLSGSRDHVDLVATEVWQAAIDALLDERP
jgi:hypothetical protein